MEDGTYVVEIRVNNSVEGPRHGELLEIIDRAVSERASGYVKHIRVSYRDAEKMEPCISCSSYAKFWVEDGAFTKPICTFHAIKYRRDGYKVKPMTKEERQ